MSNKDNKIDKIAQVAFFDLEKDINDKPNETTKKITSKKKSSKKASEVDIISEKKDSKKKVVNKTNKKNIAKTSTKVKSSVPKTTSKATNKTSTTKRVKTSNTSNTKKVTAKKKNQKVNFTQEDMDKLCELYDWYLIAKEKICNPLKEIRQKTDVLVEEDIIKTKKRISAVIDEDVWEDFDRLCNNSNHTKAEILTQIIKDYINKHSDLI